MREKNRSTRLLAGCFVALLCLLGALSSPASAERGPSTAEERAKALELVELLETTPSAAGAKEARAWLVVWLAAIPDLTVTFCTDPLGSAKELEDVPAELTVQAAFSQAAYLLRNPAAADGTVETYLAGVEGALRTYQAMRAEESVPELRAFESLRQLKAEGELQKVVAKRAKKCK